MSFPSAADARPGRHRARPRHVLAPPRPRVGPARVSRLLRGLLTSLVVTATATAVATGSSWGYWTAPAQGAGLGSTASMLPPTDVRVTGTPWADTVRVDWVAAALSSGAAVEGYLVERVDAEGRSTPACGTTPASPTTALACEDTGLPDGSHRYRVTAVHHSWTATSDLSAAFVTDVTAPQATASLTPGANATGYHTTSPVLVTLTATDLVSGVAGITYSVDGGDEVNFEGDSVTLPVGGEGDHVVSYRATDVAGRASAPATQLVRIDTIAPSVTVSQADDQADPSASAPVRFTVTFSEPVTGFGADDLLLGGTASPGTGEVTGEGAVYQVAVDAMTQDGTVTVAVRAGAATDRAGNLSTASVAVDDSVTRDTVAPAAPSAAVLAPASDTGASATDGVTSDATPTLTGTTEPGATVTLYAAGTAVGAGIADAEGVFTVTASTLADGEHDLSVRSADAAGNLSAGSPATRVRLDTVAPVVTLESFTAGLLRRVTATGAAGRVAGDSPTVTVMVCAAQGALGTGVPAFPCTAPAAVLTATAAADGRWSVQSDSLAVLTTYYARAQQVDLAGNVGVSVVSGAATTSL